MLATLLVLSSAVSFAVIVRCWLAHGRRAEILNCNDWEDEKREIDIEIFRALVDCDNRHYLCKTLSTRQFQVFQRRRIRLALRMLRLVERNAGLLMEVSKVGRLNSDPVLREQAEELTAQAIQLRLNLLQVRLCLLLQWFFPSWNLSLPAFTARYAQLQESIAPLRQQRWQQPS